jgi:hypothetical protein
MSTYGIRRDGSYYTRVLWCSHTENDPMLWVNNLINDDIDRNGGTWGAHTMGPANVVLDFFGEEQTVGKIALLCNVGVTISILEELAKTVNVYYSNTDDAKKLRTAEDDINAVDWKLLTTITTDKKEGWQEFATEKVQAKYIRIELVENHGTPPEIDWTEMNELKIYG